MRYSSYLHKPFYYYRGINRRLVPLSYSFMAGFFLKFTTLFESALSQEFRCGGCGSGGATAYRHTDDLFD
jgi:hypothetical protein